MKVFSLAILAIFCAASVNTGPTPLIQNGQKAERNEYSVIILALASDTDQRATFGGGSIISRRHILTAAHLCVNAKQFRIGYGHINAREVIRLTATSALIHSRFNGITLENDLAIITLPQNQLINVQIVTPIVISRMVIPLNQNGAVASFGFENNTSNAISEHLMVARQVVIDNQACADAFGRSVHVHQFCGHDRPTVEQPPVEDEDGGADDEDGGADDEDGGGEGEDGGGEGEDGGAGGEGGDAPASEELPGGSGEGNSNEGKNNQAQGGGDWINGWSRRSMGRVYTNDNEQSAVCLGDTGSAIIRRTEQGIVGFGIVSRVPRGCNADRPALYTRLPAFTQWLEDATLGEVRIVDY